MSKSTVKLDYKQLEDLKKKLETVCDETQTDKFMRSCAKELAARLLAKVIKRTPVGQYAHRTGGTLRRGWTGGAKADGTAYAQSLPIQRTGNDYVIEIINPVEYASYVEFGHRTANLKGWVEGRFMLTVSEKEIQNAAPKILEKKVLDYLKGALK